MRIRSQQRISRLSKLGAPRERVVSEGRALIDIAEKQTCRASEHRCKKKRQCMSLREATFLWTFAQHVQAGRGAKNTHTPQQTKLGWRSVNYETCFESVLPILLKNGKGGRRQPSHGRSLAQVTSRLRSLQGMILLCDCCCLLFGVFDCRAFVNESREGQTSTPNPSKQTELEQNSLRFASYQARP